MAAESGYDNPDEWELVDDDGFVYRHKRRPPAEPYAAAPPPPDPAVERKHRRERKKRALLKLKQRYLEEISRWELLSNKLQEMEQNAQRQLLERQELYPTTSFDWSSEEQAAPDSTLQKLIDDLLSQVEAQECIIRDISNLCDAAEALCSFQEESLQQQFSDLPIWGSPHELMAALDDQ